MIVSRELPRYHKCFICGEGNPIGLKRTWRIEGEMVVTDFTPEEKHGGYAGITHGGILTALLDEGMSWTPAIKKKILCVSAELTIRFKHPTPIGEKLRIENWLIAQNRRYYETEGRILLPDGTVTVTGFGKFFPLGEEKMKEVEAYAGWPLGWEHG
jgi:acyl-CoA thioesterase FadM